MSELSAVGGAKKERTHRQPSNPPTPSIFTIAAARRPENAPESEAALRSESVQGALKTARDLPEEQGDADLELVAPVKCRKVEY